MREITTESPWFVGKLLMTIIVLVALCAVPSTYTSADPTATVGLDVGAEPGVQTFASFYRGEEFTAGVWIEDADDLGAYEFTMHFDPAVVQVTDVQDWGFLGSGGRTVPDFPDPAIDNDNGTVSFARVSLPPGQGADGNGTLAVIFLEAVGIGTSDLELDVRLFNTAGEEEAPTVVDGQITSNLEVGVDPTEKSVTLGITETVDVVIRGATNMGGYQFSIDFDPTKIQIVDVEDGSFLGSTGRGVFPVGPDISDGTLTFGAVSFGTETGPDGEGTLATITFEAIGLGDTTLHLHDVQVYNLTTGLWDTPNVLVDGLVTVLQTYTLTVDVAPEGGGDVRVNGEIPTSYPAEYTFAYGTNVELEAVAAEGYEFVEWIGDLTGTENPTTIHMDSDKAITATFSSVYRLYKLYLPIIMKNYIP